MILGVQADIPDHVIGTAVAVEVRRRDRGPPAGPCGGKAGLFGPVLEALALVVMKVLHVAPFEREQQIGPAIAVDIAPQRGRHHADFAQPRRQSAGNILKSAAAVGEERTLRRQRILAGLDAAADEQVEPAVAIEVGCGHRANADEQWWQDAVGRGPESTASIIQEELRLIFRGARRQGVAALCHQQVLVAIAIGIEQQHRPVVGSRVWRKRRGIPCGESS